MFACCIDKRYIAHRRRALHTIICIYLHKSEMHFIETVRWMVCKILKLKWTVVSVVYLVVVNKPAVYQPCSRLSLIRMACREYGTVNNGNIIKWNRNSWYSLNLCMRTWFKYSSWFLQICYEHGVCQKKKINILCCQLEIINIIILLFTYHASSIFGMHKVQRNEKKTVHFLFCVGTVPLHICHKSTALNRNVINIWLVGFFCANFAYIRKFFITFFFLLIETIKALPRPSRYLCGWWRCAYDPPE